MQTPLLDQQSESEEEEKNEIVTDKHTAFAGQSNLNISDEDEPNGNKFDHKGSDPEDNGYYDTDTLPAKSLKVIKEIITRQYGVLFCCTVFGASIGFVIYLLESYDIWIFILGFIGFIVGLILDAKKFDSEKRTKLMVDYKPTKEEIQVICTYYKYKYIILICYVLLFIYLLI